MGAWAQVEKIIPVWAKDSDEPVKITYNVGLGRQFKAEELKAEDNGIESAAETGAPWRLLWARNKWQQAEDCQHHPHPGTFPVVVTDPQDWGGWRVPGAEYDRDPGLIEFQARLIAHSPQLMALAQQLREFVDDHDAPPELTALAKQAGQVLRDVGTKD